MKLTDPLIIIILKPQYGPSSRFVLLTFNLTCLYSFNLREEDTHVVAVASHRAIVSSYTSSEIFFESSDSITARPWLRASCGRFLSTRTSGPSRRGASFERCAFRPCVRCR